MEARSKKTRRETHSERQPIQRTLVVGTALQPIKEDANAVIFGSNVLRNDQ